MISFNIWLLQIAIRLRQFVEWIRLVMKIHYDEWWAEWDKNKIGKKSETEDNIIKYCNIKIWTE